MKYMALIYGDPARQPKPGTPEFADFMAGYGKANEAFMAAGVLISGEALQDTTTATTIREKGGRLETMDGPFAESKEQLGGYYVLDCKDLDEAIRMAAMIPTVRYGSVEIRPLANLNPDTLPEHMRT